MSKRAIILAGGRGTRLKPYTVVLPKPLMPIGEYPILEVIIRQLAQNGFDHVTLAVNHQAEIIKAFFQNGERWGIKIDYSLETIPLGTMGPIKIIKDLPENFLVMNGDVITDLNYKFFFEEHSKSKNIFTISSKKRDNKIDYGVLEISNEGYLSNFKEKPEETYQVSMGIYMVSSEILNYIPINKFYGFDNLMVDLINAGKFVKVKKFNGYWLDIGRPDDYIKAIEDFDNIKNKIFND